MGRTIFFYQIRKIIILHKRIGYKCHLSVIRQSACLVINPITVDNFVALFNCTPVDRASDSIMRPDLKLFILVCRDRNSLVCCLVHRGSTDDLQISCGVVWQSRDLQLSRNTLYLLSHRLCFNVIHLFTIMIL